VAFTASIAGVIFLILAWVSNRWVHLAGSVLILVATLSVYGSQLAVTAP
jgi:hypothetical protein